MSQERSFEIQYFRPLETEDRILGYLTSGMGYQKDPIPFKEGHMFRLSKDGREYHLAFVYPWVGFFMCDFFSEEERPVINADFMGFLTVLVQEGLIYCYSPEEIPENLLRDFQLYIGEIKK